jgi:hypothetical protein
MQINVGTVPGQAAEAEVLVDLDGNPIAFGSEDANIATYNVSIEDFHPVALATDILVLTGSATKTVKVTKINISASAPNVGRVDLYAIKRTSANTGGTISNPPIVKYDSLNPSATAVVKLYSANPSTLGTGILFAGTQYIIPGSQGNTWLPNVPLIAEYGTRNNQAITLRGVNESVAISLNGNVIPTGLEMYITIEWTEE